MSKIPVFKISNYENSSHLNKDIYVKSLFNHVCEYDFIDSPHSHDFFLFVFCTKGHGTHTVDFIEYEFKPNRLFILTPGQIHNWNLSEDIQGSILFFNPAFYFAKFPYKSPLELPLLRKTSSINFVDFDDVNGLEIQILFQNLTDIYQSKLGSRDDIFASYLNIVIHKMHDNLPIISSKVSESKFHYIYKFETQLEQYFKTENKVGFYAQSIGVSPEHLNRLCKDYFLKSCKKIINERVALEAMRMLSQNTFTIQNIAEDLSFSDLSNFVKFFKRECGITPAKFRIINS